MPNEFEGGYSELLAMKEELLLTAAVAEDKELRRYVEIKADYVGSLIQNKKLTFDEFHYRRTVPLHRKLLHILKNKLQKGLRHG